MTKAAKPAARERMRYVNVHDSGRVFRGLWIENPRGGVVIELTLRHGPLMRSVN